MSDQSTSVIDHEENCAACGVNPRNEGGRLCESCHDELMTDGGQSAGDIEYEPEPQRCTECKSIIRVGSLGGSFGAYCDCTTREGRPIHHISRHPWPSKWTNDQSLQAETGRSDGGESDE